MSKGKLICRRFPVDRDPYSRAVTFLYGSVDQINAYLTRKAKQCDDEFTPLGENNLGRWEIFTKDGFEADFICIVRRRDLNHTVTSIAHETLHYVAHALRSAGIEFSRETEEAYCYYQQWIMQRCLDALP